MGAEYLLAVLATGLLTVVLLAWAAAGDFQSSDLGDTAKTALASLTFLGMVWTGIVALSRHLLPASQRQADQYVRNHGDPMEGVAHHFHTIISLVKAPVVIFVDDLDRCTEDYVVEFLEAIQTLIREAPRAGEPAAQEAEEGKEELDDGSRPGPVAPYFVVAADGRWIRASYEKAFLSFTNDVGYVGCSLGHLFLQKVFQLSATLPVIDSEQCQAFMDSLLSLEGPSGESRPKDPEEVLEGAQDDAEILERVRREGGTPRLRGEAVLRMAQPPLARKTEHALRPYADLLDPNPRSMKRFINTYGVERAVRTIEGRYPSIDQLARWSVLLVRWPNLAEMLRSTPEAIELVGNTDMAELNKIQMSGATRDDVKRLLDDPEVVRAVKGGDSRHGRPLDAAGIRDCAGLPPR